ncbi:hypothetical protein M8J76_003488 [Diaphorina citri]|nr:hypothetical protein M8J76_003488 [Diaphorina citri]
MIFDTVDWVSKLDAQLYPILSDDLSSSQDVLNHIADKYRVVLPEIRRALAEIKLRIKTAEDLLGQGQGEGVENLGEGVPPRLKELDEKLSSIVTDYQAMLEVYQTFFQNFLQMTHEVNQTGQEAANVPDMENMLEQHEMSKQTARELFKYVHAESIQVVNKIKELEPDQGAEKDVSIVNRILNSKRKQLDHLYTNQEYDLESKKHLIQFDADLKSIHSNLDELTSQLSAIQDKYTGDNGVQAASLELHYFEKTLQLLAERIETFVTGADSIMKLETDTSHIETQIHKLKFKWNELQNQVKHTKNMVDASAQYVAKVDEVSEFCKQNRQFLSTVTMKSHLVKSPQDAEKLLDEIEQYLRPKETQLNETLLELQQLASHSTGGDIETKINQIKNDRAELNECFASLKQELQELANQKPDQQEPTNESATPEPSQPGTVHNIPITREDTPEIAETKPEGVRSPIFEEARTDSPKPGPAHSVHIEEIESIRGESPALVSPEDIVPVAKAPVFVEPLRNSVVEEGAKFTFRCKVSGFPTPEISWLKDGISIKNNLDYQTSYFDGLCTLTIDETFAEDSAKFTCTAKNSSGVAETSAFLSITECEPGEQITPPQFSLKLQDVKFSPGSTPIQLLCRVSSNPLPTIKWLKDGVDCLAGEEEGRHYRTSYRDGVAVLEILEPSRETPGVYECQATNRLGTEISSAKVELDGALPEPKFLVPLPHEAMVRAGQKLKLQCEVEHLDSSDDTRVTWLYNGKPVTDNSRDVKTFSEDTNLTLLISEAFPKDAGTYSVSIESPAGSITSSCNVSVKGLLPSETSDTEAAENVEPVKPSISSPLRDVSLFEGAQVLLDCVIVGSPEPEVIWYHNGRPVKESGDFQLLFKGDKCSLLIKEAFVEDGGEYKVVAINSAGEASSSCNLTVQVISQQNEPVATRQSKVATPAAPTEEEYTLPKFTQLLTDVLVREGDNVLLESCVEGNPTPSVKWTLNNKDIVYNDRVKSEFNPEDGKATLSISNATQQDRGLYTVRADNSLGESKCFSHVIVKSVNTLDSASSEIYLSDVFEVPEFTETFADVSIPEETAVKFECIAVGKPTPKIKWLFNEEPISGKDFLISTSGARQVCSIPTAPMYLSGGRITCVAENEAGRATCTAQLTVTRSSTESLIPILTPTMSVAQLEPSGKQYEMKRSAMFSSASSFSSRVNGGQAAPQSEVTSFSSEKHETSQQTGAQPTVHSESEHIKEYKNINGVETRNEKSTESSSANFGELISKHEILSSGGSYGSIPALAKSTSNSSITKSGPRKPVAPRFISPLNGKIVDLGADVLLEAIIEGHPTPDVKWSKNGAPLDSIPGKITLTFEHNKARLELKNATTEDGGRYTCTLDNPTGSAGSTADLIVKKSIFPPVMCRRLLPQFIYVGDRLVMEVEIAGTPTPTVKWFKDNIPIAPHSQEYRLRQQGNSYAVIVEKATQSNSGTYKVTATNEGGEALSSADVKVTEKSALTTTPALLTFSQPSPLQTENKLEQRDFTNSSTFFKQQQQVQQHQQPLQQQQNLSSYSTQENLSVSKTLLKEDKNVNLKVANEFMPLNMPYSIQSSGTETHKETVIPIQTDNKTYIENQKTESTTQVVNSDEAAKEGIEHTTIPKKCALDFFKNIIKENESEQNFLKETEKQLPPSFHTDKKKEIHHHVEKTESLLSNQYQPGPTSPVFPHSDDQIPPEFARNILNERVKTKSFEKSWKPVSPVPQPYNDTPLYLEPGPPPEICYVPKVAPKTKENFTERIKKMEESHRELSTAEVPQGGIKIFPKQQAEPVYKAPEPARPPPFKPAYDHKPVVEERCIKTQVESSGQSDYTFGRKVISPPTNGPVLRPQADIHVRPTSPRPSAEGVSMEKLWTTKLHKESEITRPASPLARPSSPKHNIINETRETSHTEIKRCISPRPSAEGVKMDKMWAHPATNHTPHPTSLMPAIPVPVKKDDEDEEAKRLAWSRKYLTEDEVTTRTVKKTVIESPPPVYNPPTPAPVYNPPAPAPVYRPPAPAPAPAYHPPAPAPVYNPPVAKQPPPPTPKPAYVATPPPPYKAPVHHVSPPHQQLKQQSSFDQTSSYKQSSFQSNQKASPPWVKSEPSQNVVTPPWVKPSPPSTPSHSTINKTFSSSEDRSYSSSTQQKPIQFKPNTYTPPYQPKPVANQYYKTESQENETKQFRAPNYSPYSSQNSNQSNSSVVQQSFSSQTVRESYQSGGNQFSSSQQQPVSFSESAVVEEHHLKPSLAKKVWPLVQNSSSSYTPVVPSFSSEPVTESSYSYEVAKTDNGYVEKEIKTQRTVQREEKQFSYPPPARSSLQSKIAAFEEKNYQSDYDSKFDSSDSEIRRTGSLKRPERPSSAAGYGTLPKTFGRSNSFSKVDYQSSHTQRFNQDTSDVIPGLKPGSPPQILHASQFYSHQEPKVKRKGYTQGDSGYMADTEESFQSKMSQDGSIVSSAQKKSMLIASQAQPSSPRHKSFEQSARTETYSKSQRKHCPPPRNPSKFVRGEFRESDYESDYESKIKPKWRPYDSDTEEITYRPVRPNLSAPKRRSLHLSQPVACPLEFDKPPVITDMRPVPVQHIVNPSGAKTSSFSKSVQVKRNDFVCPPPPPNQYHSVQNFEPKVFEDTQSMSQSESGENFHRSMNVQQSTRIMTSNGLVDGDSLLDAEKRRLQRVEEMKRRFEDKTVMEAKHSTGGELFSAPHIPSVGTTSFSSVSSAQQVSQSYHSTSSSSEQYFNSAQHQLTNGIPASQNFKPENFGSPRKEKVITLTDSCFDPEPPRRLPIFITPLRDIAVVSGGVARFECIVQADPAPSVTWSKDGQILHPSHQHQIEFRNGVCRLTLPHAYPFDAGTYSCSAVNAVGTVETSASLTVPGEKRSFNL